MTAHSCGLTDFASNLAGFHRSFLQSTTLLAGSGLFHTMSVG